MLLRGDVGSGIVGGDEAADACRRKQREEDTQRSDS